METLEFLRQEALNLGAFRAEPVDPKQIVTDASFRKICQDNGCGNYGKNYTCPPDAGPVEALMEKLHTFRYGLVYQTVSVLEDSFDFEGMLEAGSRHNRLARKLWDLTEKAGIPNALHLGAGGCRLCETCAKVTGEPCRNPKRAMASLESYGVDVMRLARQAGMRYTNAENTVTYFGLILIQEA